MKHRFEKFGGIIASDDPPFLAFVDRQYMREMGFGESDLWDDSPEEVGLLTAPTEVHMALTNRCAAGCPHCYMGAGEPDPGELDTAHMEKALAHLADLGVFHVALGGGEALERPDLFHLAAHAKKVGLVPNLTVSGRGITPETAQKMRVFGQVNVSVDGVGELYGVFRGADFFDMAKQALKNLVAAGVPAGINCVLGKDNYSGVKDLFSFARSMGLNEIEFLRLKPSGRAKKIFMARKTTDAQNRDLVPLLAGLSAEYGVPAKIDCSFTPMLCCHGPDRETLEKMATCGCEGGNMLLGARSDGSVNGCSFLEGTGLNVLELDPGFHQAPAIRKLLTWPEKAPEPCRSCEYLSLCRGGCRAVALAVTGDFYAPDPDCPRVLDRVKA